LSKVLASKQSQLEALLARTAYIMSKNTNIIFSFATEERVREYNTKTQIFNGTVQWVSRDRTLDAMVATLYRSSL